MSAESARLAPIIALADAPWDGPWGTVQQIVSRLAAKGRRVVYSNGPLSVWDRRRPEWAVSSALSGSYRADQVLVDRPGRFCATWPKSAFWSETVYWAHARHLRRLSGGDRGSILLIFHPRFSRYVDLIGIHRVVYFAYDQYSAMVEWSEALAEQEAALVARAELVFAVTPEIVAHLPAPGDQKAHVIPNAVDAAAYVSGTADPCPDDLAKIPHPRIAYVGRMTPKVDFGLVSRIATRRPDWHWVMVGPVLLQGAAQPEAEAIARQGYEQCRALPNVHFLGAKHHRDLPAYMAHVDVNTMCYRTSGGWWVSGSPLKLFEYLAVAKPIVGAPLPAIRPFDTVVDIANGDEDWIRAIEQSLEGGVGSPEQRRALAFANSWEKRIAELERWLD